MAHPVSSQALLSTTALLCAILLGACREQAPPAAKPVSETATLTNEQQVKDCSFERTGSWWTGTYADLPASVADNPVTGDPEFCEFYQFAEDWFLYLLSPSATAGVDNWQDEAQFSLLQTTGANSCVAGASERALNIRTVKASDDSQDFLIPERVDQAGREHAIYDQEGNVVFYEIRFSRNLCDYPAIQANLDFPGKTVELKMAWRVMSDGDDKSDFYLSDATIQGQDYTLGLVGWHLVVTADNHPEMVWITLDHVDNAVDCSDIATDQDGFDFTSKACAQKKENCTNLNKTQEFTTVKLPPDAAKNDICAEFPYGTVEGQSIETKDGLNIALIEKLNNELQNVIFEQPGLPAPLTVWRNYQITGALWESDIKLDSSVADNQRGSLELANIVMETSFQGTASPYSAATNCFACHHYKGTDSGVSNTAFAAGLSHIFDNVILGQCRDEPSTVVINSQPEADSTCPGVCAASPGYAEWNGQWTNQNAQTDQQLPMTVCGCCPYPVT